MKLYAKKGLALVLVLVMVLGLLPVTAAVAAEGWVETALADLTAADTVAVVMHAPFTNKDYALMNNGGTSSWGPGKEFNAAVTDDDTIKWNISASGGGYRISPAGDAVNWLYVIDHNNGLRVGTEASGNVWTLDASGYLKATDPSGNVRFMGVYDNNGGTAVGSPNFRTYTNTTGNTAGQTLKFYKLGNVVPPAVEKPAASVKGGVFTEAQTVELTCATEGAAIYYSTAADGEISTSYTTPISISTDTTLRAVAKKGEDTSAVLTESYTILGEPTDIATALAAESGEFTVKGAVSFIDGSKVYIQDATGAIMVAGESVPKTIVRGDTITAKGSRGDNGGLPCLNSAKYLETSGVTLSAAEVNIADILTTVPLCSYVKLTDAEVSGVSGTNITLKVSDSDTISIYRAAAVPAGLKTGDKVTVNAVLSAYNGTRQLRTSAADDIVISYVSPVPLPTATKLTALPQDGDMVAIYHPTSKAVMGTEPNGKKIAGVVTELDADSKLPIADGAARLTVTVEHGEDGTDKYIFTLGGKYLTSDATGNGLSYADELTDCGRWTIASAGSEGLWYFHNVGANYNGNYNQGLEYYNGFTTYGEKTTAVYQMAMYLILPAGALKDGQKVVIYNPGSGKGISTNVLGSYYLSAADVTVNADGKTADVSADMVWTVGANLDGSYTLSTPDGKKMSMNNDRNSLPLDAENTAWQVKPATTDGCYYLVNAARPTYYVEWYAQYTEFSTYTYKASSESIYAFKFLSPVVAEGPGLPQAGDKVVIYNTGAEGVLSRQDENVESPTVMMSSAALTEDGKAQVSNGGLVFTVEKNGEYFRFHNESYGYLASNGTGNNAFYEKTATDDSDWKLNAESRGTVPGFTMESRTAKFNGQYSQYMEYYSGSFKTYSMNKISGKEGYDIFVFNFYPMANPDADLTEGIVNMPVVVFPETVLPAYVGADYSFSFSVDAVFGVQGDLTVTLGGTALDVSAENGVYTVTVPAEKISGTKLTVAVSGTETKGKTISGSLDIPVRDEPVITEMTPASGSQTGADRRPAISAKVVNCGNAPTITMTVNDKAVSPTFDGGVVSYTPAADMAEGNVAVTLTVRRADGVESTVTWRFYVGVRSEQLYFGQLHSHTQYSDGAGSLDSALEYVSSLPESANIDFVAFTDHSNYFDGTNFGGTANPEGALYDMSLANATSQQRWSDYTGAVRAFNAAGKGVIALPGFEMTWSGGPGHINTWNTPGIVSRNNTTLNNKTADAGMKAYYALLSQSEGADTISQFNHPGTTFGTFIDFSYWDAIIDTRMYLVEVGNGEGAIGAGGYYPSYEEYIKALDKGWHLAPSNNQDNHKGKWGNANDARDVILAKDLSEEALFEAIREYKVYATEDKNLEIYYTVNGLPLGSMIEEVPESLDIDVQFRDPDAADTITKVEVVVNSGKVAYTWDDPAQLLTGELKCQLEPSYSYYFIRVTQGDGDLAVTAPVWVGETLKIGISSAECGTAMPVTDEELKLSVTLFNSQSESAEVKSVTFTANGSEVIASADITDANKTIPSSGTVKLECAYTPDKAKVMTVTANVVIVYKGEEYTYTKDITLDVTDSTKLMYIGIDASHYNEYVAGNYKDSMGNFANLAAPYGLRTVYLNTSEELIAAAENENGKYKMLIMTAPSRRLADAQSDPRTYSAEELAAIKKFNEAGGTVVMAGWSDYYENYPVITGNPDIKHMAAAQNEVLSVLGSSLRISDDATNDDSLNGGQPQRLYFNTYNMDSTLMKGVEVDPERPNDRMYTEVFSQYGGATIYAIGVDGQPSTAIPATVEPIVYGHASTYSKDSDNDGLGGASVPKYAYTEGDERLMVMASEQIDGKGLIIVSGAAFMSNFEVQATISDSNAEKNYANYKICENLCQYINPMVITPIADVQAETEEGIKFNVEGVVTSNASGFDARTAFFDCIYLQDASAGINAFPVAGNYKIGDKVRITGTTSSYQGERQIAVTTISRIESDELTTPKPRAITAAQLNDGSVLGSLVSIHGSVISYTEVNGLVQTIMVRDDNGGVARVFIDGYICTDQDVDKAKLQAGAEISVVGLASYDNSFDGPAPRIRVRNREDIVLSGRTVDAFGAVSSSIVSVSTPAGSTAIAERAPDGSVTIDVTLAPGAAEDIVFIPMDGLGAGTVAIIVNDDGSEEVIKTSVVTEEGIYIPISASGNIKLADRAGYFSDVPADHWADGAIAFVSARSILEGVSATGFGPDNYMNRAMLVTALYRLGSHSAQGGSSFTDVAAGTWYTDAVVWGANSSVVAGYGDGSFRPTRNVSREEMVAILYRYADLIGLDTGVRGDLDRYADAASIGDWAREAMSWAVGAGIIHGTDVDKISPQGTATRAQVAMVIENFMIFMVK